MAQPQTPYDRNGFPRSRTQPFQEKVVELIKSVFEGLPEATRREIGEDYEEYISLINHGEKCHSFSHFDDPLNVRSLLL